MTDNVTKGLLVTFDALPGKEADVEKFLNDGLALVQQEPKTVAWFAIRLGPSSFGIFDVFPDEDGRDVHLNGQVGAALGENTDTLFSAPSIQQLDVLASKLPS